MGTITRISIGPEEVYFAHVEHGRLNRHSIKKAVIDDSGNMSYTYITAARRELALRYVGMQEESSFPIWELTVSWPDDDLVVMTANITGYGDFDHEGNTLKPAEPALQLQVAA